MLRFLRMGSIRLSCLPGCFDICSEVLIRNKNKSTETEQRNRRLEHRILNNTSRTCHGLQIVCKLCLDQSHWRIQTKRDQIALGNLLLSYLDLYDLQMFPFNFKFK